MGAGGPGRHAFGGHHRNGAGLAGIRSGGGSGLSLPDVSLGLGLGDFDRVLALHAAVAGPGDRVFDPAIPAASQRDLAPDGAVGRAGEPSRSGGQLASAVDRGWGCRGSARRTRDSGGQRDPRGRQAESRGGGTRGDRGLIRRGQVQPGRSSVGLVSPGRRRGARRRPGTARALAGRAATPDPVGGSRGAAVESVVAGESSLRQRR